MTDTISNSVDTKDMVRTWSELASLVQEYRVDKWIFRGVDNAEYTLLPKIGRPGARKDMDTGSDLPFDRAKEFEMLSRFQREVLPHIESAPRAHIRYDWDLQAVAQHHGLKTRFLDWSESPLIAAFFAVEPSGLINGVRTDAALYGVPWPHV